MHKLLFLLACVCIRSNSFGSQLAPEFTAVFNADKNAVLIRWQHRSPEINTYVVQRSSDKTAWTDIASQGVQSADPRAYYTEDRQLPAGENFYRLKCVSKSGIEYSREVMVAPAGPNNSWVMYPVPVTDLLTLDYRGEEPIKGVINIFITQSSGRVLTKLRYSSLNKSIQVPVSNFGKGVYDVRIVINSETVWNQRFIK